MTGFRSRSIRRVGDDVLRPGSAFNATASRVALSLSICATGATHVDASATPRGAHVRLPTQNTQFHSSHPPRHGTGSRRGGGRYGRQHVWRMAHELEPSQLRSVTHILSSIPLNCLAGFVGLLWRQADEGRGHTVAFWKLVCDWGCREWVGTCCRTSCQRMSF